MSPAKTSAPASAVSIGKGERKQNCAIIWNKEDMRRAAEENSSDRFPVSTVHIVISHFY
jgi:hypothetical protein